MKLIVREKDYEYEYLLNPGVIIVGRDETCDLAIASQSVSKRHLSCSVRKDRVEIKDLGSRNGTKVNGQRVGEARLSDGDEVRIGEVSLTLKMPPGHLAAAGGATRAAGEQEVAADDLQIEDEEVTPTEGSLVRVDPGQQSGGLYERDGHWYVSDPATGREVEIVPAEQKKKQPAGAGPQPLLATKKGRVIIGGSAAVVLILFLLLFLTGQPQQTERDGMTPGEFDQRVQEVLDALRNREIEEAARLVQGIKGYRYDLGAADSLELLVTLWGGLEEDFPAYWEGVREQLRDLRSKHSPAASFANHHIRLIEEKYSEYTRAEEAKEHLNRGEYEDAYLRLRSIQEDRPVRRDNEELYERIRARLRRHLAERVNQAVREDRWQEAREATGKLMDYFPDTEDDLREQHAEYETLAHHAGIMRRAEAHATGGKYEDAIEGYGRIPETSRYFEHAQRERERAETLLVERTRLEAERRAIRTARNHFHNGEAREALRLLEDLDSDDARSLRNRINDFKAVYNAALAAEADRDFAEAERIWRRIRTEWRDLSGSEYYRNVQSAIDDMPIKRRRYAQELAERAESKYRDGRYREARELFAEALGTDPDGEIGAAGLRRLEEEGTRQYMAAIRAIMDNDTTRALELLKTVMDILPTDHSYHQRAIERKDEIKRQTEP